MALRGSLVSLFYEYEGGDRPGLTIFLRTRHGKKRVRVRAPIRPYFFCREKDLGAVLSELEKMGEDPEVERGDYRSVDGHRVVKVSVCNPRSVGALRRALEGRGVKLYEADIKFRNRVLIDTGVMAGVEISGASMRRCPDEDLPPLRVGFFDIECDDSRGFPRPERDEILSIALVADDGRSWFFCENSESKTISKFLNVASTFDVLAGWNSSVFDLPYLRARCRIRKERFEWRQLNFLDLMELYRMYSRKNPEQLTLDYVARVELGAEKLPRRSIREMYEADRRALMNYNVNDADLVRRIDAKLRLTSIVVELAALSGVLPEDAVRKTPPITSLVLREANGLRPRFVFPCSRGKEEGAEEKARGAVVFPPVPGIHRNVAVIDFQSLYPSIAMAFNISPETLDPRGPIVTERARFTDRFDGIFRRVLVRLFEARMRYKRAMKNAEGTEREVLDIRQNAIKVMMNSFYGVTARPGSRFFTLDVAESITLTGRRLITLAKEIAEAHGAKVIYGDTDSLFIELPVERPPEVLVRIGENFADLLTRKVREFVAARGGDPRYIRMTLDKFYSRILLTGVKKRYAGLLMWKDGFVDRVDFVGFETIRGDAPPLLKEAQARLIGGILRGEIGSRAEAEAFIASVRDELLSGKRDGGLVISKGLSKDLSEYAVDAMHVRAAKKLLERGGQLPPKVQFVIADVVDGRPVVEPVVDDEIPTMTQRARKYYWERMFREHLEKIVEAAFGKRLRGASLLDFVASRKGRRTST